MKKVLFVASEGVPFIKTGGLADVVGSLPKYLSKEEFDAAAQKEIADKKVDTPEKLEKFNKFMAYTWENGDVNHDNYLSPEEFAAQRQRNREKFSRKK